MLHRIVCFLRPHRLEVVKSAIAVLGVNGMSISDVRGTGDSADEVSEGPILKMPIRSKIEVVVRPELTDSVLAAILNYAHTGERDDGKVFVEPIEDAIRIRTNEHGEAAV